MSGNISFNPYQTTSPQNTFLQQSQGYIQGVSYDDPSAYQWLDGGYLASTETLPMWGGVPVEVLVNLPGGNADGLGSAVKRAVSQATSNGWCTFNQAASMVITPGNSVPLASVMNYVAYYLTGTFQRIAVQADPALAGAATNVSISALALYWDVTNYRVTTTTTGGNFALPASTRLRSINSNSKIVAYNSGTGAVTWTTGSAAIIQI